MRKDVGGSAGLLAVVALFLHTQLPNSENGAPSGRSSSAATSENKNAVEGERTEIVGGPWLATQAFFHAAGSSLRPQESDAEKSPRLSAKEFRDLLKDLTSAEKTPNREKLLHLLGSSSGAPPATMFSIVATVADPSHTHMSLLFDEQTEAIEGAARDAGWDFAEQWLPWVDRFNGNEADITARRAQRRVQREQEELPGVLVFRHEPVHEDDPDRVTDPDKSGFPDEALFVFLVPETLTAGINGPAFYSAMHLAQALSSPESNQIGLLAPTFSGSFASLSQGILNLKAGKSPPRIWNNTIYGGTVSNRDYAIAFENKTRLTFHSGVPDSRDVQVALCTVLENYHMDKRAAVLKEDEGGLQRGIGINRLGEPATCGGTELQTYVIPREISHLRNAYQEASGDAAKDPYSEQQGGVNFSIRDPNSGEDSIPTFSETQTPLSQETILNSITGELSRQHTRVVFISVSNPLDALFLLQALRTACPDIRVILEGPNVLFVAAAAREALGGTLFLSPYPMFFEGDDWLECTQTRDKAAGACAGSGLHQRIMFAEPGIQGLYNVTQFLLMDLGASSGKKGLLRGYRQPAPSSRPYPGIWLLTLNRFGFLPVDLLPNPVPTKKNEPAVWFEDNYFKLDPERITVLPAALAAAPRAWMITVFIVSLAILSACITFVCYNIWPPGDKYAWLVLRDNYESRFEALLCACLSLCALEWILALPWCISWNVFFPSGSWRIYLFAASIVLALASPAMTLAGFAWYLPRHRAVTLRPGLRNSICYTTPIVMFGIGLFAWFYLCKLPGTGLFFRFRAMELYSGSSPALPLALACTVFFCISLLHLKQHGLAGLGRPRLKIDTGSPQVDFLVRFRKAYDSTEQQIAVPWKPKTPWVGRTSLALVFVAFCFVMLGESARAFELPRYNTLLWIAISAILFCLATKSYDLLSLWSCVRKLLDLIQMLPLRPAIQRIAADWPKQAIWALHRSLPREAVQKEMLYSLHRRAVILKTIEGEPNKARAATAGASEADSAPQEPATQHGDANSSSRGYWQTSAGKAQEDERAFSKFFFGAPEEPGADARLKEIENYQESCADLATEIYTNDLTPVWRTSINDETDKSPVAVRPGVENPESLDHKYVDYCADFVALQFCSFVAYAVEHIQRMATSLSLSFVLLVLIFNSYRPDGPQLVARFMGVVFVVIGIAVWRVFSQMERDPILSTMAHTTAGELSGEFWIQLLALGGLPLLGVLGHLFPSVSHFLFQWIAPSVEAAH